MTRTFWFALRCTLYFGRAGIGGCAILLLIAVLQLLLDMCPVPILDARLVLLHAPQALAAEVKAAVHTCIPG